MALTKVRNLQIANSEANVVDYGADPTGTSDSTAAIQAAIDAGSNVIVFPAGTYLTTAVINVNSNQTLLGHQATITAADGDFHDCFSVVSKDNVTFEGLRILATDGDDAFDIAIFIQDCTNVTVNNCYIHNIGIDDAGEAGGFGVYCRASDNTVTPVYGTVGNFNIRVTNNTITKIKGYGTGRGDAVYMRSTQGSIISQNKLGETRRMTIAVTDFSNDIRISDNYIYDCYIAGIDFEPNQIPTVTGESYISNNVIRNFAIKPAGFVGSQFQGIDIRGGVDRMVVDGNIIIAENSQSDYCIKMQNSAGDTVISNNILSCLSNASEGMRLFSGSGAINLNITGNEIIDFTSSGVFASDAELVTINNNIIKTSSSSAGTGIRVGGGTTQSIISANLLELDDVSTSAIYAQNNQNTTISSNNITVASGDGIYVYSSAGSVTDGSAVLIGNTYVKGGTTGNTALKIEAVTGSSIDYIAGGNSLINATTDIDDIGSATRTTGTFV